VHIVSAIVIIRSALPQSGEEKWSRTMEISDAAPRNRDSSAGLKPLSVTVRTAQDLIGIKNTKIWELISDGTVETVSIGKRRLVIFASIERLIEALRQKQPERSRSRQMDRAIEASVSARRTRKTSFQPPTTPVEGRSPASRRGRRPQPHK
jgi:hypothetical protein